MHILIMVSNEIIKEQRIGKEIETLYNSGHKITVLELPSAVGVPSPHNTNYELVSINLITRNLPRSLFFWPLKYIEMSLRFFFIGCKLRPDIVHCVDRLPLPVAYLVARKIGIAYLYDSQEIHSEVNSSANKPKWFWLIIEKFLAKRAIRTFVTDHFRLGITSEILGLNTDKMFSLMSYPRIPEEMTLERTLRNDCNWLNGKIGVYAGALCPGRHLEDIIASLVSLPMEYKVVLIGFVDENYKQSLLQLAINFGIESRIIIMSPVRWFELPQYIASADCAFAFYEKNSLNNYYCSPSKLFDALMAGLPVISSDNPLTNEILQQDSAGICINEVNPKTIATAFKKLLEDSNISEMKCRLSGVARAKYSWESQVESFIKLYSVLEKECYTAKNSSMFH